MPERLPLPPGPYRYRYEDVTAEIERFLTKKGHGIRKQMASACGMDHTAFSHRMAGRYRFSYEQVGAIAEAAGAPAGWPWVKWAEGEALDAMRKLVNSSRLK